MHSGVQGGPSEKRIGLHFICHSTHLMEGKFNLFIDNDSDTNKPKILKIGWKSQIKFNNNNNVG